jgi:hypothetical protein
MHFGLLLLFLLASYPLGRAWHANKNTSLLHAVNWALAAWVAWGGAMMTALNSPTAQPEPVAAYVALCLTGCTGVAVLGARRPGAAAWNFVVLGLLAVMLLPLAEHALLQTPILDPVRAAFLGAVIAMGALNYLPTGLAGPAFLTWCACLVHLGMMIEQLNPGTAHWAWLFLGLAPWSGVIHRLSEIRGQSEFDRIWLRFRDRFGFVWSQRVREQFNRSAANSGWPVILGWGGLRLIPGAESPDARAQTAIVATLQVLLKRFENASDTPAREEDAEK